MISAQNKSLGVADDDVQPMKKARIRIVGSVLVSVAFQRANITAIAVTADHAAIGKGSVGKLLHRRLLEIGGENRGVFPAALCAGIQCDAKAHEPSFTPRP